MVCYRRLGTQANLTARNPDMIQNRYKHFRWTKRTAGITFVYVIVVPTIVGYLGYKNDVGSPFFVIWVYRGAVQEGHKRVADVDCYRACGICGRSGGVISCLSAKEMGGGDVAWGGTAVHRLRETQT